MNLKYTSISNLLLLPESYNIEEDDDVVQSILKQNKIFNELYKLEESIQPILASIEEAGLVVAEEWFKSGLEQKHAQLRKVTTEMNQYINGSSDGIEYSRLREFWRENHFPIANNFDSLKRYKHLHPTYRLMMLYRNHEMYLKMWGKKLLEKGDVIDSGVLLKGRWRSFSCYTGRMTARNLPLTSMPIPIRDYIVSPKGHQIVSLDLDNAELRFLAHYAKCDSLVEQFGKGIDIHAETAKLIRKSLDSHDINEDQSRKLAKEFTYSLLYGAGTQTIAKNMRKTFYDVTSFDVSALTDTFYQKYPELLRFLLERAEDEKLLTPFGKIRPIVEFTKTQRKNFAMQSSVSVAIKVLLTVLAKYNVKIIHVIHDEVWILVPKEESVDCFITEVINEFKEKINEIFPGLPMNQVLTKEKIGGK